MLKSVNKITKSEEFASTKSPKAAGILTQWVLVVLSIVKATKWNTQAYSWHNFQQIF